MKKCLKYRPETSVSHKWNIGFKTLALDLGIKKGLSLGNGGYKKVHSKAQRPF